MKKIITILAVMLIVVCAAFADATEPNGDAKILVNAKIGNQYPAFQLQAVGVADAKGSISGSADKALKGETKDAVTITEDALLGGNVTVNFAINQVKMSRTKVGYVLTVTATDLKMVNDASGAAYTGAIDANKKFEVSGNPTITKGTAGEYTYTEAANALTVRYNGKKVDASTANAVQLGTFSCVWQQNADADAGDYQATVTLTITSAS
ncbi:MAG: hypothetical protein MJ057_01245 [Sphaerochaetaceae bacterium]|nr:hypothetical protein [Sphaerochaetaceae bacterium]